ncbi:MAG: beta-propeller domain-containing protein [Myxococcaceae bacterium]
MPRHAWGLATLLAATTGCGGFDFNGPMDVQRNVSLRKAANCAELEQRIEDAAVREMRAQLDSPFYGGISVLGGRESIPFAAGGDVANAAAPQDYTQTNNQVSGVDEADFVKNDGTRLFVLSGQRVHLLRSWPAQDTARQATISVDGYGSALLLEGNRLAVISHPTGLTAPFLGDRIAAFPRPFANVTKVTLYDVTSLSAPVKVAEHFLPGTYNAARNVGGSLRLVLSDALQWPEEMQWWVPGADSMPIVREQLKAENERLIRTRTLAEWLRTGWRELPNGARSPIAHRCEDFQLTDAPVPLGLVSLATLPLNDDAASFRSTTILGAAGVVYASTTSLYVAAPHYWGWWRSGQKDYSYIHQFDISTADDSQYLASGVVEGTPLNQFALDEHAGHLRVATTLTEWRSSPGDMVWTPPDTSNRVTVFRRRGSRLEQVGVTPDLAQGERLFAARFLGDRGFLVTFLQVDPLFTLDLSDPKAPKVVGELKVPGFSTYLHPIGNDHLLAMGVYQPENGNWSERRLQLSLFNVSDLANPVQSFTHPLGTAFGFSEAGWDHKAFTYFAARGLLAIPLSDYEGFSNIAPWGNWTSELRLIGVSTSLGFTPRGAVDVRSHYPSSGGAWSWRWSPYVRRSVFADDFVYAITDAGVRVANIGAPATPVANVVFPAQ